MARLYRKGLMALADLALGIDIYMIELIVPEIDAAYARPLTAPVKDRSTGSRSAASAGNNFIESSGVITSILFSRASFQANTFILTGT